MHADSAAQTCASSTRVRYTVDLWTYADAV